MKSWQLKNISEVYDGFFDGPHATPRPCDEGPIFLGIENLTESGLLDLSQTKKISPEEFPRWTKRILPRANDIVFSYEATLNRYAIIPRGFNGCLGRRLALIRPNRDKVSHRFLLYYFLSSAWRSEINNYLISGSTVDRIPLLKFPKFKIYLPQVSTQRKIAAILSSYDDLIENNKRRIVLLEKMAEEIYREWFVRLRFPGHEKVKIVKGVPEGWDNTHFGKFCMLKRGYDLPDQNVEPGDYPVIASTSIKTYHNEFKAEPPVITTGRSGSLGIVLMVNRNAWPLNTTLYVKDFFGNSPYLVFYTLKNMGLEKFNSGAGVPTLNRNHINGIKMAVPDKDLQRRFDAVVSPMHEQKEQIIKANEALAQTRDLLLPRLISGKLSVENLDIQFPPSMAEEMSTEPTAIAHASPHL